MGKNLYIFDCFGVVISDVSTLFMDKRLNAEQIKYMREQVYRKVDTGKIGMDEMFEILAKLCGMSVEQTKREWKSYEYVLTDTIEVIKKLKSQGHTIALLTNAASGYIHSLFRRYDLFKYFDSVYISSVCGYAKPDKEFYEMCIYVFTEQFDNVYFTDDNPDNLVGLEQYGITPVLFKNAKDFAEKVGV